MLSNVLPRSPVYNTPYRGLANAELSGESVLVRSSGVQSPYLSYIGLGQPRAPELLAADAPESGSPLSHHVLRVGLHRSEEQVSRFRAGRVVAVMQDAEPIRDRAVVQLPRYPVGLSDPRSVLPALDNPVPDRRCRPSPAPARAKLGTMVGNGTVLTNLRPVAIRQRHAGPLVERVSVVVRLHRMLIAHTPEAGSFRAAFNRALGMLRQCFHGGIVA